MGFSIQDYLRKINSSITRLDCISLLITTVFLISFSLFLYIGQRESDISVSYNESVGGQSVPSSNSSQPFASKSGKTYTFSWCQGANMIGEKNKIYYTNEDEAKRSGKVLSKLCQK